MKIYAIATLACCGTLLAACASTPRQGPVLAPWEVTHTIPAGKARLLAAVKQVLAKEGYTIATADDAAGSVSATPRDMKLTPEQADCGMTGSGDYVKPDAISVTLGAVVDDNRVTLKSTLSAGTAETPINCVSRGPLEDALFEKIAAAAR